MPFVFCQSWWKDRCWDLSLSMCIPASKKRKVQRGEHPFSLRFFLEIRPFQLHSIGRMWSYANFQLLRKLESLFGNLCPARIRSSITKKKRENGHGETASNPYYPFWLHSPSISQLNLFFETCSLQEHQEPSRMYTSLQITETWDF